MSELAFFEIVDGRDAVASLQGGIYGASKKMADSLIQHQSQTMRN
jgi:hypothetical protein